MAKRRQGGKTTDRRPGSTTAQLRRDIDSGRTGDKAPALDPAAAPLGTDDEAAGTPPSPAVVSQARRQERGDLERAGAHLPETSTRWGRMRTLGAWLGLVAVAVVLALLALMTLPLLSR